MEVETVTEMSLVGLGYRCQQQTTRFWQKLASDPQFCYELMRRALQNPNAEQSKVAWGFVQRQYERQAMLWVKRHKSFPSTGREPDELAQMALAKMWVSFANNEDKFGRFPPTPDRALKALLKFMQLCIHSVIMDALRTNDPPLTSTEDETITLPSTHDASPLEAQQLWECVQQRLKTDKERIVVDAAFVHGIKPRHIYTMHRDTFTNVKEIHRTKENVLARLRRDATLRQCFGME